VVTVRRFAVVASTGAAGVWGVAAVPSCAIAAVAIIPTSAMLPATLAMLIIVVCLLGVCL
jgi:hypothetical protein